MNDTPKIAALDAGLSYHTRTLREPPFAQHFGTLIDLRDLGQADLTAVPCLMIPCRTNGHRLSRHRSLLQDYMAQGGQLVVMGECHPELFLDGVDVAPVRTNYWWWLDAGADLGVRIAHAAHPLLAGLAETDATWHIHGTLTFASPSETLIRWSGAKAIETPHRGGAVLSVQRRGSGSLIVTTLDPIYHHGSGFMPATTLFLKHFLPALRAQIPTP